jgi:hypothetical protein
MDELNNKIITTLEDIIKLKNQQINDLKEHVTMLNKVLEDILSLYKTN